MKTFLTTLFCFAITGLCAQQLTYTPKNPNFGGDTFNYQWLLSSANAQDSFKDPNEKNKDQSALEEFQESLNEQALGQLTQNIFNNTLGDELTAGTFTVGSLVMEIYETDLGFVINILDTNNGEETQVIVPN